MKLKLSIFALLALLMASCTQEIDIPEPVEPAEKAEPVEKEGEMVTITATIPQETRVSYNEGALGWQDNDKLLLAGYDGTTYKGSSTFTYTGNGNQFTGTKVDGATTYKAYYPGDVITLDGNGNMQLPANFWQQTQSYSGTTDHLRYKLLLSDTNANALSESFALTARNSVIKFELTPGPIMTNLKKMIWTVETVKGVSTRSAILDIVNIPGVFGDLILYLAFDPTVMKIAPNGTVKIMLIGDTKYEWSTTTTKVGGMTYAAGKRYNATVSGPWTTDIPHPQFRYTITTTKNNTQYEIWQRDASSISPANLEIDWGDGTANTTISKGASLAKTIASHTYANAGTRTITITSDEVDPTVKQMPQLTFFDMRTGRPPQSDIRLKTILDPFPNMGATNFVACFRECNGLTSIPADLFRYNANVTTFYNCFYYCTGLTSIPVGLFSNNTQATMFAECFCGCSGLTTIPPGLFNNNTKATDFDGCFASCSGLTTIPAGLFSNNTQAKSFYYCFYECTKLKLRADIFPDPATNANFFAGKNMNFEKCFYNVGTSAATAGTAPELWMFNGGGGTAGPTSWTITNCFTGANVVNRNVIPKSWGGDLADLGNVTKVDGEDW